MHIEISPAKYRPFCSILIRHRGVKMQCNFPVASEEWCESETRDTRELYGTHGNNPDFAFEFRINQETWLDESWRCKSHEAKYVTLTMVSYAYEILGKLRWKLRVAMMRAFTGGGSRTVTTRVMTSSKLKHFPRYWPFVRGMHRSPVNSPQRSVTRSFDVFFDLCLNQQLSKQWRRQWFGTPSSSSWRHCNGTIPSGHDPPIQYHQQ